MEELQLSVATEKEDRQVAENLILVNENEYRASILDLNRTITELQCKVAEQILQINVLDQRCLTFTKYEGRLSEDSEATVVAKESSLTDTNRSSNQSLSGGEETVSQRELNSLKQRLESEISNHALSTSKILHFERLLAALQSEKDNLKDLNAKQEIEHKKLLVLFKSKEEEMSERLRVEKQYQTKEEILKIRISELETKLRISEDKLTAIDAEIVSKDLLRDSEILRLSEALSSAQKNKERLAEQINLLSSSKTTAPSGESASRNHDMLLRQLEGHEQEIVCLKMHKTDIETAVAQHRTSMDILSSKLLETQKMVSHISGAIKQSQEIVEAKISDRSSDENDSEVANDFPERIDKNIGDPLLDAPIGFETTVFNDALRDFIKNEKSQDISFDKSPLLSKIDREKAFISHARSALMVDREAIKTLQGYLQTRKDEWKYLKSQSSTKQEVIMSSDVINRLASEINRTVRENKFIKSWLDKRMMQILTIEKNLQMHDPVYAERKNSTHLIEALNSELDSCFERLGKYVINFQDRCQQIL